MTELDILRDTTQALTEVMSMERELQLRSECRLPNVEAISQFMRHISGAIFPHFFGNDLMVDVSSAYSILRNEIVHSGMCQKQNPDVVTRFISALPEIKRQLLTDITAITHNDPAATGGAEAVFCYPGVKAMLYHRTAHQLFKLGVPMLPRIISEQAHQSTGIDIHPAAQIGDYFAIDHGTGIVIGETTIIGNNVMLYQGVTLGSRNFQYDEQGHPMNIPRHPIIEDNVTIFSNSSVLGRITIGHDSVIGGNLWVTSDVPAGSRLSQHKLNHK